MPHQSAFLVIRKGAGFGRVHPLEPNARAILGRADTNEVVLEDDLCSRQHAEVKLAGNRWTIRDCGSLNGTKVNETIISEPTILKHNDEIAIGRSRLVFVTTLEDLKAMGPDVGQDGHEVVARQLTQTRYDHGDTSQLPSLVDKGQTFAPTTNDVGPMQQRLSRELSFLYRLALRMGSVSSIHELRNTVLESILEITQADGAAMLYLSGKRDWKTTGHMTPKDRPHSLLPPPPMVIREVLAHRQAILAVTRDRFKVPMDGSKMISSLILAPLMDSENIEQMIYVYSATPLRLLGQEQMELVVAIGKQFSVTLKNLKRQDELVEENQRLKAQVVSEAHIIGHSPEIELVLKQITKVGAANTTVLIRGESGVGKELVARAIHLASPRKAAPFVCLNCAALAETLLESELFGHEKGAFTGATERKIGKFEAANHGTIFLDEIGEMSPTAQAKLLRILEGHPYERIGGTESVNVSVRVVAATNRPLEEAVRLNKFRKDLYYRLQVVELRLPALRERISDIPVLAEHFLDRFKQETGKKVIGFTPEAMERLRSHSWPGNIRELRNVIERAVVLSEYPEIDSEHLWLPNLEVATQPAVTSALTTEFRPVTLETVEKEHIHKSLRHCKWIKSQAAVLLGIERSTLDRKIKIYDLKREGDSVFLTEIPD